MIKYLFLDFGGCIDAPGIHTRVLFWDAFRKAGALDADFRATFQEAYTLADQKMMGSGEAKEMNLEQFNRHNAYLIVSELKLSEEMAMKAADEVSRVMRDYILQSKAVLEPLSHSLPLGLISNFTGNLEVILDQFGMRTLFHSITESFYAGHSKPELEIFRIALAKQPNRPKECLYIGDNPKNDIHPARALGIRTALIHTPENKVACEADAYLTALSDLPAIIQKI